MWILLFPTHCAESSRKACIFVYLGGATSGERNELTALIPLLLLPGPLSLVAEGQGTNELLGNVYGKPQKLAISLSDTVSVLHSQSIKLNPRDGNITCLKAREACLPGSNPSVMNVVYTDPWEHSSIFVCAFTEAEVTASLHPSPLTLSTLLRYPSQPLLPVDCNMCQGWNVRLRGVKWDPAVKIWTSENPRHLTLYVHSIPFILARGTTVLKVTFKWGCWGTSTSVPSMVGSSEILPYLSWSISHLWSGPSLAFRGVGVARFSDPGRLENGKGPEVPNPGDSGS